MDAGIVIRRGTPADSRACHRLLYEAVTDFEREHGIPLEETEEAWWAGQEPFQRYLAAEATEWWVAQDGEADVASLRELELELLGFHRSEAQLRTLLDVREAYLYHRGAAAVGFSFVSRSGIGPLGALEPTDQPSILLHVEGRLHAIGVAEMELDVPGLNGEAIRHLLSRGFRFDPFMSFLLSDRSFGRFDRFIGFHPPLFL